MGSASARSAFGGLRLTLPRRAIAKAATEMRGAFSVEELTERVRSEHSAAVGTATVYRAVAAMETTGFIERVGTRRGQVLYARCGADDHHHHVVCEGCGRMAVAECPVDTAAVAPVGFLVTRHEVTLYGLCPTCSRDGLGE